MGRAPSRDSVASSKRPFAITDLKLRALPVLLTFLLGIGVPLLGLPVRWLLAQIVSADLLAKYPWLYLYAGHTGQLVGALACIAVMRRFIPGHYGLRLPRGRSYIGAAVAWASWLPISWQGFRGGYGYFSMK